MDDFDDIFSTLQSASDSFLELDRTVAKSVNTPNSDTTTPLQTETTAWPAEEYHIDTEPTLQTNSNINGENTFNNFQTNNSSGQSPQNRQKRELPNPPLRGTPSVPPKINIPSNNQTSPSFPVTQNQNFDTENQNNLQPQPRVSIPIKNSPTFETQNESLGNPINDCPGCTEKIYDLTRNRVLNEDTNMLWHEDCVPNSNIVKPSNSNEVPAELNQPRNRNSYHAQNNGIAPKIETPSTNEEQIPDSPNLLRNHPFSFSASSFPVASPTFSPSSDLEPLNNNTNSSNSQPNNINRQNSFQNPRRSREKSLVAPNKEDLKKLQETLEQEPDRGVQSVIYDLTDPALGEIRDSTVTKLVTIVSLVQAKVYWKLSLDQEMTVQQVIDKISKKLEGFGYEKYQLFLKSPMENGKEKLQTLSETDKIWPHHYQGSFALNYGISRIQMPTTSDFEVVKKESLVAFSDMSQAQSWKIVLTPSTTCSEVIEKLLLKLPARNKAEIYLKTPEDFRKHSLTFINPQTKLWDLHFQGTFCVNIGTNGQLPPVLRYVEDSSDHYIQDLTVDGHNDEQFEKLGSELEKRKKGTKCKFCKEPVDPRWNDSKDVTKSGYTMTAVGMLKTLKKVWCVVQPPHFLYFDDYMEYVADKPPRRIIHLDPETQLDLAKSEANESIGFKFGFVITAVQHNYLQSKMGLFSRSKSADELKFQTTEFFAESGQDRLNWVEVLTSAKKKRDDHQSSFSSFDQNTRITDYKKKMLQQYSN